MSWLRIRTGRTLPNFSGNLVAARPEAFEFLVCSPRGFRSRGMSSVYGALRSYGPDRSEVVASRRDVRSACSNQARCPRLPDLWREAKRRPARKLTGPSTALRRADVALPFDGSSQTIKRRSALACHRITDPATVLCSTEVRERGRGGLTAAVVE